MSHLIHPRVFYCEACGCADRTSAGNINSISDSGLGAVLRLKGLGAYLVSRHHVSKSKPWLQLDLNLGQHNHNITTKVPTHVLC